jgi:predicted dehydrogenase
METTRRDFIKKSAIAAAGTYIGTMGMSAKSYGNIIGANDRVRVGVVGFSDRFKDTLFPCFLNHYKELNFDIVALSDLWSYRRDLGLAHIKGKVGHDITACRNNDELYNLKDLDAVIISSPDFAHASHAIEAVHNKKDVYCEKPFAETMEDARAALKAVRSSKQILQIGSQRRSGQNYQAAAEFIKQGKFGDITMVELTWNVNQPGRWRRPDLVAKLKEEDTDWKRFILNRPYEPFNPRIYLEYRLFWPYSSGMPGQWMSHQIDTVHWFTGLPHPRSVTANGGIYQWKDGRRNWDTTTAVFDYGPLDDKSKGFQVNVFIAHA